MLDQRWGYCETGLWPTYYEEKIQQRIREKKIQFGDELKTILEYIKNLLTPNNRQTKDNIINHLEETKKGLSKWQIGKEIGVI